jgi:hypothetical protein
VNVVRACEPSPPDSAEPIEWLLRTNDCAFEKRQLHDYESLVNALAPDPGWLTIARGFEKPEGYTLGWRARSSSPLKAMTPAADRARSKIALRVRSTMR